jgi:mono/diheme cytochrome c family protein
MPTIPDFTSMAWQMSKTDLEIAHQIQNGQPPKMPPFGDKLRPAEMLGLTIYARAFAVPLPDRVARAIPPSAPGVASTRPASSLTVKPREGEAKPPEGIAKPHGGAGIMPAAPGETESPAVSQKELLPASGAVAHMSADQIYRAYCLACHGEDGHGSAVRAAMPEIPDFASAKWQVSRKDAELKHSILEGKGKFMLPMRDKVGEADVEPMVVYLRRFSEGKMLVGVHPAPEQGAATLPPTPEPAAKGVVQPPEAPVRVPSPRPANQPTVAGAVAEQPERAPQLSQPKGPVVALAPATGREQRITVLPDVSWSRRPWYGHPHRHARHSRFYRR